jgi:hypothetical protein
VLKLSNREYAIPVWSRNPGSVYAIGQTQTDSRIPTFRRYIWCFTEPNVGKFDQSVDRGAVEDGVVLAALFAIVCPDSDVFPVVGVRMLVEAIKEVKQL